MFTHWRWWRVPSSCAETIDGSIQGFTNAQDQRSVFTNERLSIWWFVVRQIVLRTPYSWQSLWGCVLCDSLDLQNEQCVRAQSQLRYLTSVPSLVGFICQLSNLFINLGLRVLHNSVVVGLVSDMFRLMITCGPRLCYLCQYDGTPKWLVDWIGSYCVSQVWAFLRCPISPCWHAF